MKNWTKAGYYRHNPRYFTEDFRDTSEVAEQQDSEHIAGSGGCFVAGTMVNTLRGLKPIEKVKVGDVVLGYDRYQNLERGAVRKVHVHTKEEQDSDIITFTFGDGETLTCTGNHGIYRNDEETPFVEAQELDVGDKLLCLNGAEVVEKEITDKDVKLLKYKRKDFKVYNLTVHPQHTYIAGGVLVHNGGGGKSGDGRAPVEGPNTLRSRAVVRVAEVISEGEIEGLYDNEQGILFDDTPILSAGGQPNFENVSYVLNEGTADQDFLPGFSDVEAETAVGVEASFGNPVPRTVAPGTDAARVKVSMPAGLYTTDLSTGDITGHTVTIKWERRFPSGSGTWETVITDVIRGKATSIYQKDYRIPEPLAADGAAWDVRMSRVSADETKSTTRSNTFFDSYTEIQEIKLTYPNTAVAAIEVDAESTGGNVPLRSYDVLGIKVKVPTNYDPLTRVYTGAWDGSFKVAWTDNPAWVVYDLISNERYGLGEYVSEDLIDKFEFYDAAVYNDELVDDGDSGLEPRYTFNGSIMQQQDAWSTILAVASSMRASVIGGSTISLMQDRPTAVSRLVTQANVIDGRFTYASNALGNRNTVARVTFNDPNDRYLPKTVTEESTDGINRYGFNPTDVATIGCTSEGQARRIAKWFLETELNTPELCTFQGGFEIADLIPGEVVKIMDRDYAAIDVAGRVAGGTTTTEVVLDRDVTLNGGETYTLSILDPSNGAVEERTVTTAASTTDTLTVTPALPGLGSDFTNASFILESDTGVQARQFRVVSKVEDDRGKYTVTCAEYDPTRYARIESGITVPPNVFSDISAQTVDPISDIEFQPESYVSPTFGGRVKLRCNWTSPDPLVTKYSVQWRKDNGQFTAQRYTTEPGIEIDPIEPGEYELLVYAVNVRGTKSVPYLETYTYAPGVLNDFLPPVNLRVAPDTQGGSPTEFTTQDLSIYFDVNPANDDIGGLVQVESPPGVFTYVSSVFGGIAGYKVVWKDSLDNVLETVAVDATPNVDSDTFSVKLPYATNVSTPGGPHREIKVDITTLSTDGAESTTTLSGTLVNPVPGAPSVTLLDTEKGAFVQAVPLADDRDVAGMVVVGRDTGGDYTPISGDILYSGADLATQIGFVGPFDRRSIKVACYDTFSNDFADLVFSTFSVQEPSRYGITPLTALPTLPTSLYPAGVVVYLVGDEKLYRVSADGNSWVKAVDGADLTARSLTADKIVAGDISAAEMGANSITAANAALADASIRTAAIQDLSVETIKLSNDAASNVDGESGPLSTGGQPIGNLGTWQTLASATIDVDPDGRGRVIVTVSVDASLAESPNIFGNPGNGGLLLVARITNYSYSPGFVRWTGLSSGTNVYQTFCEIKGSYTIIDEPPPGPQTYNLELIGYNNGFATAYRIEECTIVALEAKK